MVGCYTLAVDVERTIDFILKTQAKTEVRLSGITKLIQRGMRLLAKNSPRLKTERTLRFHARTA